MATVSSQPAVGQLLRDWRERRRVSQMEVSLDAGVSARHLSFVETGRSKPGREMLLSVADRLGIPYRERNEILLAAGDPPPLPERALAHPAPPPGRQSPHPILPAHQ